MSEGRWALKKVRCSFRWLKTVSSAFQDCRFGWIINTHPLRSCERSIRLHSNNFYPSRSYASCSTSFQLVQPRSFRSASTVLLPTKTSYKFSCFFFSCRSVPVYFVWLKYISWFMYGFEALIINQWKDYGPICMYHFFPVRMSVIHGLVLIKRLYFAKCAYTVRFVMRWTVSGFQRLL